MQELYEQLDELTDQLMAELEVCKTSTPQFFECEYWHSGQQDDKARNIVEGALLLLWGSLAYDSWQDKQTGQNRSKAYLKVREIGVIRPPKQQYQAAPPQQYRPQPTPQAYQQAPQLAPYAQQQPAQAPMPAQAAYAPQQPAQAAPAPQQASVYDVYDEDIPF